jgi:hypothetical protein
VIVELGEDSQYVCRLDDMWFHFCQWQLIFLFSIKFPASYSMSTLDSSLGKKKPTVYEFHQHLCQLLRKRMSGVILLFLVY